MAKRRHMREYKYVQDGPNGTPKESILKRWMRKGGKRRIRRLERHDAVAEARAQGRRVWDEDDLKVIRELLSRDD